MTLNQLYTQLYLEFEEFFGKDSAFGNLFQLSSSDSKSVDFDYLTQVSSVFSSKIEGNSLDLNSYFNQSQLVTKSKEFTEIFDLSQAYNLARTKTLTKTFALTESNLLKAHKIATKSFLESFQSGHYRTNPVGVFGVSELVYMAVESELVKEEMQKLLAEIKVISKQKLTICETIFYAGLIHLKIAQIHPFIDGNGRIARLIEKWFLAGLIGDKVWNKQPEKYIFENKSKYYNSINLGLDYYNLDYSKANTFLQLIAQSYL